MANALWRLVASIINRVMLPGLFIYFAHLNAYAQQVDTTTPVTTNDAPRIALVTFGPGPQIWARFGHNAIRVSWPDNASRGGSDRLYNFGYFDFNEPGFYWNYASGNMQYYAVAEDPSRAFAYYRQLNRSLREQVLDVTPQQAVDIASELNRLIQPDQRRYPYDYFFNNCSTRVRDVLNSALGDVLNQQYGPQPAPQTLRWDALRMVQDDLLLYLGLHIGLGRQVDQPISRWDAAFLPGILADQVSEINTSAVLSDQILHDGRAELTTFQPRYWSMLLLGLLSIMIILLPGLSQRRWVTLSGLRLWLLFSSLAGLLLLFLWLISNHEAAWRNENLLLLLPTNLLLWRLRNSLVERLAAWLIPAAILIAVLLKLLPHSQYNTDLLLWFIPAQLAVFYCWHRYHRAP